MKDYRYISAMGAALLASAALAFTPQDSGGKAPQGASDEGKKADSAGGVSVQFEKTYASDYGKAEAVPDADKAAQAYRSEKGWNIGRNGSPETGFIAVIGTAPIVGGEPGSFDQRRRQAAKEAMLNAKKAMVQYLAAEVSTNMRLKYVESTPPMEQIAAATTPTATMEQPGAMEKLYAIVDYEIDQQLKSRNIDPSLKSPEDRAKAEAEAKKVATSLIGSTQFSDAVNIVAEHELSGLQAFRSFESVGAGGTGKVAVICVYSKKSAQLQRALLGQGPAPTGLPKGSITSWARSEGPKVLLYTHGVQVRTNENGEVVLVGFGQSTPLTSSERQVDAAAKKARAQAMGELRRFMGELVVAAESNNEASTARDFADDTSEFKSQAKYEEEVSAVAQKLLMPGILEADSWTEQHPGSDRKTAGCVLVWSVSEAIEANALRDRLKAAGGASGGVGIGNKRPAQKPAAPAQKPASSGKPSQGQGAAGEDPE